MRTIKKRTRAVRHADSFVRMIGNMNDQPICDAVFADRYALPDETSRAQACARVARALALVEPVATRSGAARRFYRNLLNGALGAGRIMARAGAAQDQTMASCFVHPIRAPAALTRFHPDLDHAIDEARLTLAMGGDVGYDFSEIPPAHARPDADQSTSPGVCAALDRFDRIGVQAGEHDGRRRAQLAVLRCDHPDLLAFVAAKRGRARWETLELAVAVTDAFMQAVEQDLPWTLRHPAPPRDAASGALSAADGAWTYATTPARHLWREIVATTRDGEGPGLVFVDAIDAADPLRGRERIDATSPCGAQPLPPYGSGMLGAVDLSRFVHNPFGAGGEPRFDFAAFDAAVRVEVRFLDNALDVTRWPLAAHARESYQKRRIGVGVTGLADMLAMMRLRYDSPAAREMTRYIASDLRNHAYAASAELAAERGAFPLCDRHAHLDALHAGPPLPHAVCHEIERNGLRNSHLTSFAPVVGVSLAFGDNCSPGIEPARAWIEHRPVRTGTGATGAPGMRAENHAHRLFRSLRGERVALPDYFATDADIAPSDRLAMRAALQPYVDAGVANTLTLAGHYSLEEINALLFGAWRAKLKSVAIRRADVAREAEGNCEGGA
ncbi:ribonucleotide reductase N-terminal alpha domain-containing protein [Burkholderia mayonis]|uniref:Ribonucleoside-diphosphate reductase n=1 Tax=Burkholderia mayonis TaxID=1385591 RepID=A0A1B4FWD5_9BURK|nr:ribonucleotide reductase N-terminal alpha domain-containing protein [Burkholderia mayonis]AOJ07921.1 ribonucleotide reductase-like protein [Burkholderia mayonis]KVE55425.1 ribonucleotide reductase-like protein [Burkholderia mayonis]